MPYGVPLYIVSLLHLHLECDWIFAQHFCKPLTTHLNWYEIVISPDVRIEIIQCSSLLWPVRPTLSYQRLQTHLELSESELYEVPLHVWNFRILYKFAMNVNPFSHTYF